MATERVRVATSVAIAFPRSPTVTAMAAWDIQQLSRGRFALGLGPQVKAHIERRFGVAWSAPAPRMREYVGAARALWRSFQTGVPLRVAGEHYRLSLLTLEFNPGPIDWPAIPIHLGGLNPAMCRLAGEVADGFRGHLIMTPRFLDEVARPALRQGASRAGRDPDAIEVIATSFQALGDTAAEVAAARERARRQVGFYLSTPAYRPVLAVYGWQELGER